MIMSLDEPPEPKKIEEHKPERFVFPTSHDPVDSPGEILIGWELKQATL